MKKYKRIDYEDRLLIERMLKYKSTVAEIAQVIGKSRKSIYYEIKKGLADNLGDELKPITVYSADKAQQVTDYRSTSYGPPLKIGSNHKAAKELEKLIRKGYSPYAASVILKNKGIISLSTNTIYSYIYSGVLDLDLSYLIQGRRKQSKTKVSRKHKRLYGRSIEDRPDDVLKRDVIGHWEMDTVMPRKTDKACLLVLTERLSRYEIIVKLPDKTAHSANKAVIRLAKSYGDKFKQIFKTITCDNGSEFAYAPLLETLGIQIYYAHPFSSFERGSNENNNKFIRRFYPKGSSLDTVSGDDVKTMQEFINTYPRLIFDGKTAKDVLYA